jgi:hypothetical protein
MSINRLTNGGTEAVRDMLADGGPGKIFCAAYFDIDSTDFGHKSMFLPYGMGDYEDIGEIREWASQYQGQSAKLNNE